MDENIIRNRKYISRVKNFSGLLYGKICPADIDGFIDFGDKIFIFIEGKYGTAPLPYGQRLALSRLADAAASPIRKCLIIITDYTSDEGDIDYATCHIREVRVDKQWKKVNKTMTAKEGIDYFLKKFAPEYLDN